MGSDRSIPIIVADSTVSLPPVIVRALHLRIVPFEIHHSGTVFIDGIDLTTSDFYSLLRNSSVPPTTAAPKPGEFIKAFSESAEYSDRVICLTIAESLSAANASAHLAKLETEKRFPNLEIQIIDTHTAGPGEGLIAMEAGRLANQGAPVETVVKAITRLISHVQLIASLETLYYVSRSGRIPKLAAWLGNLLQVKPMLSLSNGQIKMLERPRTMARALDRMLEIIGNRLGDQASKCIVMHSDSPQEAANFARRIQDVIRPEELVISEFTPVIGCHTGPGLVGCAFHPTKY